VRLHVRARAGARSPIAELIERGFRPWIDARRVRRCRSRHRLGLHRHRCAKALPRARVDAVDISDAPWKSRAAMCAVIASRAGCE